MTMWTSLAGFAVVAGLVTVVPGLDTALVARAVIADGRRHALATAVGISAGVLVWGVAAAVGVSALLAASSLASLIVRVTGAANMAWIGALIAAASTMRRLLRRRRAQRAVDGVTGAVLVAFGLRLSLSAR